MCEVESNNKVCRMTAQRQRGEWRCGGRRRVAGEVARPAQRRPRSSTAKICRVGGQRRRAARQAPPTNSTSPSLNQQHCSTLRLDPPPRAEAQTHLLRTAVVERKHVLVCAVADTVAALGHLGAAARSRERSWTGAGESAGKQGLLGKLPLLNQPTSGRRQTPCMR